MALAVCQIWLFRRCLCTKLVKSIPIKRESRCKRMDYRGKVPLPRFPLLCLQLPLCSPALCSASQHTPLTSFLCTAITRLSYTLLLCRQEHTAHMEHTASSLCNTMLRAFCTWDEQWLISLSQMPCIRSSCNFLHSSSSSFSCLLNSGELDGSFSRLNWHSLSSLGTAQCKLNSLPLGVTKGTEAYVSGFGMETTDSC